MTSAFLNNVTTVLLLTPMLLYIAKVMNLNPIPFLLTMILASNVGGAGTLIGDPPNIMIASSSGLTFNEFILTMGPIAVVDLIIIIAIFYLIYGRGLKVDGHERQAMIKTLDTLDERAAIQDTALFKKSIITIFLVIVLFFLHSSIGQILHPIFPFVDPAMTLEPAEVAFHAMNLAKRKNADVLFFSYSTRGRQGACIQFLCPERHVRPDHGP